MDAIKLDVPFTIHKGEPLPLGVKKIHGAVHFSIAVQDEEECRLNLYKKGEVEKYTSIVMDQSNRTGSIFSVSIEKFPYEQFEYMYEVRGREFIDPCAPVVTGRSEWGKRLTFEEKHTVRGGFSFHRFDWGTDKKLFIPYKDLILYRLHVRGFTKHESSKVKHKGTFLGVTEKISYLKKLGINAIEFMPVYDFDEIIEEHPYGRSDYEYMQRMALIHREFMEDKPEYKVNYWGYCNQNYYFAPKSSFAAGSDPAYEFKKMVRQLHQNGIEVILELHFPQGTNQRMIAQCMSYWVNEYHVDGFRFNNDVVPSYFIATDPLFSDVKLLCSGWDTYALYGERNPSYKNIAEYNDNFLYDMRKYLKGDEEQTGNFVSNFKCNPHKCGRINYITNTNGFTLMDLYSYDIKHNEDNGEDNRDGSDYNYSWNCGTEGPTRKKKILDIRKKQIRNALLVLLLSQGTPLILAGDEFGNSQNGNNNAYCQDNEITWLNWNQLRTNRDIFNFTAFLIALRKEHPILHMADEMRVMDYISCGYPDISFHGTKAWYPDYSNYSRVMGVMLCGKYARIKQNVYDNFFFILFNMHWETHSFDLPSIPPKMKWSLLLDSSEPVDKTGSIVALNKELESQQQIKVKARSIVVLISTEMTEEEYVVFVKEMMKKQKREKEELQNLVDSEEL